MSPSKRPIVGAPAPDADAFANGAVAQVDPLDDVTQSFSAPSARYELAERLHASPTTTVWRARDTLTGEEVVLKRLEPASAADPIALQRFNEEAATLARLDHPNALPLTDRVLDAGGPALVFPFYPGGSLAARVAEGPLDVREAARIARDIADVLAAAHAAGIVHRDVKPANVLLGDDGRCRLIDFGIARSLDDGAGNEGAAARLELTGSGMTVGTLPYMAPEQLTGAQPSPAVDVYALGVVLYEMLSGRRPFGGTSPVEHLALQHEMPTAIDAPDALAQLAYEALDPVPERRPSAMAIERTLKVWLATGVDTEAATASVETEPATASGAVGAVPATMLAAGSAPRRRAFALAGIGAALAAFVAIGAIGIASPQPVVSMLPGSGNLQELTGSTTNAVSAQQPGGSGKADAAKKKHDGGKDNKPRGGGGDDDDGGDGDD